MISVIVPIYNVEKYMNRCIESIRCQTYTDLEIILIDDGSTDTSPQICDNWANKDSRIRVIHKSNGGLADARNAGIEVAKGEYISFIDSDDYIEKDMLTLLFNSLISEGADIAVCGINYVTNGTIERISCLNYPHIYSREEALKLHLSSNTFNASACNKLYKRYLFNNIRFPKGKKFEDTAIMAFLFDFANKISHIADPKYYYVYRIGSLTKVKFSMKDFDLIEIEENILRYFSDRPELYKLAYRNVVFAHFVCVDKIILYQCKEQFEEEFKESISFIKRNVVTILSARSIETKYKIKTLILILGVRLYSAFMFRKNSKQIKTHIK